MEEPDGTPQDTGGTALLTRLSTKVVQSVEKESLFPKRRIAVRRDEDNAIVAVIELISSGNKHSQKSIQSFLEKSRKLIDDWIHLLVVDPYPPSPATHRDCTS